MTHDSRGPQETGDYRWIAFPMVENEDFNDAKEMRDAIRLGNDLFVQLREIGALDFVLVCIRICIGHFVLLETDFGSVQFVMDISSP